MHKVTVVGQPFTFVGALHYVYLILYIPDATYFRELVKVIYV